MMKMNKKIVIICLCLLAMGVGLVSCGSKEKNTIQVKKEQNTSLPQTTEEVQASNGLAKEDSEEKLTGQKAPVLTDVAVQSEGVTQEVSSEVVVYVCGAVNQPGVYTLSGNPRMADAVEAAGGMSQQADRNVLNLAQYITDGQMIRIPAVGEVIDTTPNLEAVEQSSDDEQGTADSKVDLNSASASELMTVPGIGQSKAEAIIRYREENGRFEKVEDIMQISGIKEGSFQKMEPYICVK